MFQVGLDQQALELPLVEPVHGANTIKGGDLTQVETGAVLALPLEQIKLFDARLVAALEAGELNTRQYVIVRRVLDNGQPLALAELRQSST